MISETAEERAIHPAGTSKHKKLRFRLGMWLAVLAVFAAQMGLFFWLGNPPTPAPLRPPASTMFHFVAHNELLALQDPTIFLLPHRDNFSGAAWLQVPAWQFKPVDWNEPVLPLALPTNQLGAAFMAFVQTNTLPRVEIEAAAGLGASDLPILPLRPISGSSRVRLEGDLARLTLLTTVHLPPQTNSDLLTNTVVRLLVDAQGRPFSEIVLQSCGNADVDSNALVIARSARFEPVEPAKPGTAIPDRVVFGTLVFEWQTIPPAETNAADAEP